MRATRWPDGGTIDDQAKPETQSAGGRLSAGTYVRLQVIDTGSGMDEATLARATEPFFTTKGLGKGTGLGLSMVDGLASQSGGQFVLSSTPGVGTTAELWLPATEQMPASEPDAARAIGCCRNVAASRSCWSSTTTAWSCRARWRCSRSSATPCAVRHRPPRRCRSCTSSDTVQLLLTDQAMPQMTGAQLIGRLRDERPALPVILATGYAEIGIELPASVVRLTKPFGQQALAQAIAASMQAE